MARYNYMNRGYTDDQNKTNYECTDHVCRPIIVDNEGKKRPIISYTPNHTSESYVTRTERTVEHIRTPVVVTAEYKYSTVVGKVEPLADYGVTTTEKWRKPSSPVLDRPQIMATDYEYNSPAKVEPRNNYVATNDKWQRSSSPVHQYGYSSPTKVEPMKDYGAPNDKWCGPSSPIYDHPQVGVTKYRYSSPPKVEPMKDYEVSNDKWRRPSSPVRDGPQVGVYDYGYNTPTKVEPVKNYGATNDKWRRPSSPIRNRYGSPTKVEPVKNYGVTNDKWRRPSSPVRDRYGSPTKVEPVKNYGVTNDTWRRPSSPVHDRYGYNSPTKVEPEKDYGFTNEKWRRPSSPVEDRPQKVEEFITRVQTETSRPTRPGLLTAPKWLNNTPNSTGQDIYGDYTNYNNKPSGNTIRDESRVDPFIANRDGKERSSHNGWTTPQPLSYGTPLSGPTNDIDKAVEILKEAAKTLSITPPASQPRMTVPISTVPKKDTYTEIIDSREAERRYGKLNQSSRPFQTEDTYTGTIDSREAARKYKGANVR